MKTEYIVQELRKAVEQLGVGVRLEQGRFRGGPCTIGAEEMLILNKRHPAEMHLGILAEYLRHQPTDSLYLRPAVRAALEQAWAQHAPVGLLEDDPDG